MLLINDLDYSILMYMYCHPYALLASSLKARDKAIRNRTKVAQSLDKLQHSQRQEAAKQRREEKKKLEKERMMNETDPEKTRKWEVSVYVKVVTNLLSCGAMDLILYTLILYTGEREQEST